MPESTITAIRRPQFIRRGEVHLSNLDDDELRDSISALDEVGVLGIRIYQNDLNLASITAVDEAGRVQAGDPMICGETTPRQHHRAVVRRKFYSDPRTNPGPTSATLQLDLVGRHQVAARIARMRVARQGHVWVELEQANHEHGKKLLPAVRARLVERSK